MRDIIVDMQTLKDTERKDLVKYIQFLCQDEKQGGRQRQRLFLGNMQKDFLLSV